MLTLLILDAPQVAGVPPELERVARRDPHVQVIHATDPGEAAPPGALESADVILTLTRDVDATMIARAGRCWMILIYGAALRDHAPQVDLEAARAAGIYVASTPDFASRELAARAWSWIERALADRAAPAPRLGIVGLGGVGREVARLARAARVEPWVCDPLVDNETFDSLGVRRAPLAELLGMAHVVSLHVSRTPATRAMIGAEELALLAPRTWLINAASPETLNIAALEEGLSRGRPGTLVWPAVESALAAPGAQVHCDAMLSGNPSDYSEESRRAAARVIEIACSGGRPPHLLIDPPCPRHALKFNAGSG